MIEQSEVISVKQYKFQQSENGNYTLFDGRLALVFDRYDMYENQNQIVLSMNSMFVANIFGQDEAEFTMFVLALKGITKWK